MWNLAYYSIYLEMSEYLGEASAILSAGFWAAASFIF